MGDFFLILKNLTPRNQKKKTSLVHLTTKSKKKENCSRWLLRSALPFSTPLTALVHSPAPLHSAMAVLYVCTSRGTPRWRISPSRRMPSSSCPALEHAMMPALKTTVDATCTWDISGGCVINHSKRISYFARKQLFAFFSFNVIGTRQLCTCFPPMTVNQIFFIQYLNLLPDTFFCFCFW